VPGCRIGFVSHGRLSRDPWAWAVPLMREIGFVFQDPIWPRISITSAFQNVRHRHRCERHGESRQRETDTDSRGLTRI
jgi:hypothetical protein